MWGLKPIILRSYNCQHTWKTPMLIISTGYIYTVTVLNPIMIFWIASPAFLLVSASQFCTGMSAISRCCIHTTCSSLLHLITWRKDKFSFCYICAHHFTFLNILNCDGLFSCLSNARRIHNMTCWHAQHAGNLPGHVLHKRCIWKAAGSEIKCRHKSKERKNKIPFFFLQPLPYIDFEGQGIGSSSHYKNVLSHTQI